jgi:hypothetical protein
MAHEMDTSKPGGGLVALDDLHDVVVHQNVVLAHLLRVVLRARAPNIGAAAKLNKRRQGIESVLFQLTDESLMQAVAEVLHRGMSGTHDYRLGVIGNHATRLRVAA